MAGGFGSTKIADSSLAAAQSDTHQETIQRIASDAYSQEARNMPSTNTGIKADDLERLVPFDLILKNNYSTRHHDFDPMHWHDGKLTKDDLSRALIGGYLTESQAKAVSFLRKNYGTIRHVHADDDIFFAEGGIEKADLRMLPGALFGEDFNRDRLAAQEGYVEKASINTRLLLGLGVTAGVLGACALRWPLATGIAAYASGGIGMLLVPAAIVTGTALGLHYTGLDRGIGNLAYYGLQKQRMWRLARQFE